MSHSHLSILPLSNCPTIGIQEIDITDALLGLPVSSVTGRCKSADRQTAAQTGTWRSKSDRLLVSLLSNENKGLRIAQSKFIS